MTTAWEDESTGATDYDDVVLDDDLDDDIIDADWGDEGYLGEDEESRATRRRRARAAQRVREARRRRAIVRARSRGRGVARTSRAPVPAPARNATAAIRNVELESQVADDDLRRDLNAQRQRMNRSDYGAVAGIAVSQFMESFRQPQNPYLRAILRTSPLLLLSPQRRDQGFGGFVTDPRVLGAAAVAGITFLGEQERKQREEAEAQLTAGEAARQQPAALEVIAFNELPAGAANPTRFPARVFSKTGELLPDPAITWDTTDAAVATVDANGNVTPLAQGRVFIITKVKGLPDKFTPLTVI